MNVDGAGTAKRRRQQRLHTMLSVKITVFSCTIVIDVIDHCHTAGPFESNGPYHRVVGFGSQPIDTYGLDRDVGHRV